MKTIEEIIRFLKFLYKYYKKCIKYAFLLLQMTTLT